MARLVTCGFEQQQFSSTGGATEGQGFATNVTATETTVKHGGAASLACGNGKYAYWDPNAGALSLDAWYYFRTYFRVTASPSAATPIIVFQDASSGYPTAHFLELRLNTDRTLRLNSKGHGGSIGSASSALTANTWYRLEVGFYVPSSGASGQYDARIDGVSFTSGTTDLGNVAPRYFAIGDYDAISPGNTMYFDDVALNDTSGSDQNSWPGDGQIVLLKPTSDNSITGWTDGDGSGTLFGSVDNTPPTGSGTPADGIQIKDSANNATDNADFNLQTYTAAGVTGTVRVVQAVAQVGNSTTTSRNVAVKAVSNPADSGEVNIATGTTAAAATPTGWKTGRGNAVYSPSVTLGTSPVLRIGKRTATTDTVYADFAGLLVDYTTIVTQTQPVAVPVWAQVTKTQSVAVPVLASTQVTKTLEGIVTVDPATTVNSRWSSASSHSSGLASITSGEVVFPGAFVPYFRVVQGAQVGGSELLQVGDCAISFDLHPVTVPDSTYAFRLVLYKDANNYYELLIAKTAGGTSAFRKCVAGTTTSLGTVAKGVAVGTTKRVHVHRTGTTYDIYIDGSHIGAITDSGVTGALNICGDSQTGTADVRVGNFNVTNGSSLVVRNVPTGGAVRLYDATGATIASATASGGTATLDLTAQSFPVTGYVQVFTDSYTTPASNGRFPGDDGTGLRSASTIYGADELHYQLTDYKVIGNHFAKFYSTTQSNAHNGVIYNGNYAYGLAIGYENSLVAFKRDMTQQDGQAETYQVGAAGTVVDQHAVCDIVFDSSGYLHAMYGGYAYGYSMYYMKSNTPYGWNDWGTPSIVVAAEGWSGGLMVDQADKLHFVGTAAGSDGYSGSAGVKYMSKASGGAWSSATTLISSETSTGWFFVFGDCTIGKEPSGQQSLNFTVINTNGSTYRAYFLRSTDGGSTWRGLNAGAYSLPMSPSAGVVSACEQPYTGTDAYVVRLAADPDTTTMHATMQKLSDATNPVYIRGTTSGGWAAPSQTFTGFNTGPAIETVLSNVVVLGAIVGQPNTVARYNSTDGGVTWKGPTTMVTGTNTAYPPEWYWAKATRIPNSENLRVLWQSRNTGYTAGATLTDTGEGTASLYLADVQAVSAKTQPVAIPVWARVTQTLPVAVPAFYRGTASTSVAVTVTSSATSSTKTQAIAVPVVTRRTTTQPIAVPVTGTATAHTVTQSVAVRVQGTVTKTQAVAVVVYDGTPGPTQTVRLPATANFVSARSQTADFVSARSQTADFIASPTS